MADIIRMNVPVFLRILELAREDIKDDADLHDIAEIAIKLSKENVITMKDYSAILDHMKSTNSKKHEKQLLDIKRLGGINASDR